MFGKTLTWPVGCGLADRSGLLDGMISTIGYSSEHQNG